jgi:hypothetical protein
MNLRKLYHKNRPRDKNIPQNMNIYFVGKNVRKCYFFKNSNAKKIKGAFYYNWCPEYISVYIKRPLKIRCAEIWSNTILKLQINIHPNIYKTKNWGNIILVLVNMLYCEYILFFGNIRLDVLNTTRQIGVDSETLTCALKRSTKEHSYQTVDHFKLRQEKFEDIKEVIMTFCL